MLSKRSQNPSFSELIAFESAARLKSFTYAAEELNLTQGAVSRQIRSLEETIGIALFERVRRSVVVTDAGSLYLADIRKLLGELAEATERAAGFGGEYVLNLAVLPTFATRWLIPRMPLFLKVLPGVTVNFLVRLQEFNFDDQPFDAAIHYGDGRWPGAKMHFLCHEQIVAVASPQLKQQLCSNQRPDLSRATLLHQTTRPNSWVEWLSAQNIEHPSPGKGPRIEQFGMIVEAAIAGMGVALVPKFLALGEIMTGRLVELPTQAITSTGAYWLAVPERKQRNAAIVAFASWLTQEITRSPELFVPRE